MHAHLDHPRRYCFRTGLFLCAMLQLRYAAAQMAGIADPAAGTFRLSAAVPMRPSMVARYATIDAPVLPTIGRTVQWQSSTRQLIPTVVAFLAILTRAHPML